jgi:4-diphosphocytidyl-2-C-methyl-D-erythritol kinase
LVRLRLPSLAKINVDLRVLHRQADGFHELRTVFQTVSLQDEIDVAYTRSRTLSVKLDSEIPDNLVEKAVRLFSEQTGGTGKFEIKLTKSIPMGAGLGGGSSNAAAMLLALPSLTGTVVDEIQLHQMAAHLGSDVPFFLNGGTQLGIGRGTELYPLPDLAAHALLVLPAIHVSTPEAYRALNRARETKVDVSQFNGLVHSIARRAPEWSWCRNDFEVSAFAQHPELGRLRDKLAKSNALVARMSGSGSTLFGLYASAAELKQAQQQFSGTQTSLKSKPSLQTNFSAVATRFVSASQYRSLWRRALKDVAAQQPFLWPPQPTSAKNNRGNET